MTFLVVVQPTAKKDIARNANWWAENHSIEQAIEWVDTVELQLQELNHTPERFGFAAENGIFAYPLRQMLIGSGKRGLDGRSRLLHCDCRPTAPPVARH